MADRDGSAINSSLSYGGSPVMGIGELKSFRSPVEPCSRIRLANCCGPGDGSDREERENKLTESISNGPV